MICTEDNCHRRVTNIPVIVFRNAAKERILVLSTKTRVCPRHQDTVGIDDVLTAKIWKAAQVHCLGKGVELDHGATMVEWRKADFSSVKPV